MTITSTTSTSYRTGCGTERRANPAGRIKGDFRAHHLIQVRGPAGLGTERPVVSVWTQPHPPTDSGRNARQNLRDGSKTTSRRTFGSSESPGRPASGRNPEQILRDGSKLPDTPSDTSKGPGRPRGARWNPDLVYRPKKCSRLHNQLNAGNGKLLAPAGAAPSPEHRLVGHRQQEPTCCPRGVGPCGSGEHRS